MALTGENLLYVSKAVIPTLIILFGILMVITYFPEISLFLPRVFDLM
jgi:TRAP-type C4-dicarboxylate transport system permease large subunit